MQDENMGNGIINPFPGQATEWVNYASGSGDSDDPNHSEERGFTRDPSLATAVTSLVRNTGTGGGTGFEVPALHKPVLDIDLPVRVVESSTPGHHHLFIDRPMPWDHYVRLLCVLAEVGLVEPGYVAASIRQGHTSVRLPHVKRDTPRVDTFPVEAAPALPLPPSMPADLSDPTGTAPAPWWLQGLRHAPNHNA